jgi:hypothetical protein
VAAVAMVKMAHHPASIPPKPLLATSPKMDFANKAPAGGVVLEEEAAAASAEAVVAVASVAAAIAIAGAVAEGDEQAASVS